MRVPANGDGERPGRILTPQEAATIVAAAEAQDALLGRSLAGPLLALAFGTGLRSGELLALRWGPTGLDLDRGMVRVTASLDRDRGPDGAFALVPPKSRASRRQVPLPPSDLPRLLRHRLATGRTARSPSLTSGVGRSRRRASSDTRGAPRSASPVSWSRCPPCTTPATPQLTAAYVGGTMAEAGGGWSWILSDLKTLLETGASLEG